MPITEGDVSFARPQGRARIETQLAREGREMSHCFARPQGRARIETRLHVANRCASAALRPASRPGAD